MIYPKTRRNSMFQKLAPLIILVLFAIGAYYMKKGMDNAIHMAKPKKKAETTVKP
jgi:hypothetical protein